MPPQDDQQLPSGRGRRPRTGAAAVEFACVAPLLFLVVLGIIEFGRAMMVAELLNNAARNGCRVGALAGSTTTTIETAVEDTLEATGITGATTSVKVNGTTANASTAVSGDVLTVTVTISYTQVSWLPVSRFLGSQTLGTSVVMRRE